MARITAELTSGTLVSISNGRHEWRADEPLKAQGTDLAPNPYDMLVGSLAACTCITLSLYAQHKGIPLKSVSVVYEFRRLPAEGHGQDPKTPAGRVEQITSRVRLAGDFDEAQRKRLTQVAERCPVHRTLANGVQLVDDVEFA